MIDLYRIAEYNLNRHFPAKEKVDIFPKRRKIISCFSYLINNILKE